MCPKDTVGPVLPHPMKFLCIYIPLVLCVNANTDTCKHYFIKKYEMSGWGFVLVKSKQEPEMPSLHISLPQCGTFLLTSFICNSII